MLTADVSKADACANAALVSEAEARSANTDVSEANALVSEAEANALVSEADANALVSEADATGVSEANPDSRSSMWPELLLQGLPEHDLVVSFCLLFLPGHLVPAIYVPATTAR